MSFAETPLLLTCWAVLALAGTAGLVRILLTSRLKSLVVDRPNARSLHVTPVPRIGGVGLLGAAFLLWGAVATASFTMPVLLIALALAAVSLADDIRPLSPPARLAAHFAAAVALAIVYTADPLVLVPLVILTVVWMSNLYNFMDGSDGLAGGMALFGFGVFAIAAHIGGAGELALASAALAGAAAGFLIWNFPKARIFMGDVGSVPLGFLAAALGYLGWRDSAWPFYFPALAFLPFIGDATVTLLRRFRKGEPLSTAHRSHYYQRLNRMGWGHRKTALCSYALMAGTGASALLSLWLTGWQATLLIGGWLAALAVAMNQIDRAWSAFDAAQAITSEAEIKPI